MTEPTLQQLQSLELDQFERGLVERIARLEGEKDAMTRENATQAQLLGQQQVRIDDLASQLHAAYQREAAFKAWLGTMP